MNYIKLIGIELEGGWDVTPPDVPSIGHDGSVHVQARYVGEIASPPLEMQKGLEWAKRNHPTATNETCGLHVHISFKRVLDYARLADSEDARRFLIDRLKKWGKTNPWGEIRPEHPFWARLDGLNRYCLAQWSPSDQIPHRGKNDKRYQQMNFCWGLHKTVEVRVLPAFKVPEVSVAAIAEVCKAVNDYLTKVSRETKEVSKRIIPEIEEPEKPHSSAEGDILKEPMSVERIEGDVSKQPFIPYAMDGDYEKPPFIPYSIVSETDIVTPPSICTDDLNFSADRAETVDDLSF